MKFKLFLFLAVIITVTLIFLIEDQEYTKTNNRLYINGQIITLEDGTNKSEAMLVIDGKIKAVGTNKEILKFKSDDIEVFDLKNKTVLPGFIDSHSHVALASFFKEMVDLSGFRHNSNDEVWSYLSEYVKSQEPGKLIIGKGIDSSLVKDLKLPTLKFLDKIAPNNPVILVSQSMHTYWANTAAFEAMGITKDTAQPSESSFYGKDEEGNLSGIIIEQEAMLPFLAYIKEQVFTPKVLVEATLKTFKDYAQNGNTTVVSTGLAIDDKKPLRLYEHLASERTSLVNNILTISGLLPKREPFPRHFVYIRHDKLFLLPEKKQENDFYNILGVKHWYDGSPYTGSMYLKEPYKSSDFSQKDLQLSLEHRGEALVTKDALADFIKRFHTAGWQIAIHAQGDQANEEVLDVYAESGLDFSHSRHRLEHCLLLTVESIAKLKQFNILPNFHMNHLLYYGDVLKNDLIGEQRTEQILALGSAKKANVKFSMHADQPMFESKPFRLIQTAIERKTSAGNVISPEQRITLFDAIKAMTLDAAYFINMENKIGSLKEGKYADFIIIDQNPFDIATSELDNIKILKVFVNGNLVQF
ncbi:MAG: putative amidohydrolase YtcJ [Enterobacterales bacterium]|jgi:predicted amidohydrolase YtcJ